jgi:hypothetical protein
MKNELDNVFAKGTESYLVMRNALLRMLNSHKEDKPAARPEDQDRMKRAQCSLRLEEKSRKINKSATTVGRLGTFWQCAQQRSQWRNINSEEVEAQMHAMTLEEDGDVEES